MSHYFKYIALMNAFFLLKLTLFAFIYYFCYQSECNTRAEASDQTLDNKQPYYVNCLMFIQQEKKTMNQQNKQYIQMNHFR